MTIRRRETGILPSNEDRRVWSKFFKRNRPSVDPIQVPRVPLDVAHQFLATFGMPRPTKKYERWVKPDGFDRDDFHDVLVESPFIFLVDWRAELSEELARVARALTELDSQLDVRMDATGDIATLSCRGCEATVKYVPAESDDFTDVILAMQSIMPPHVEFRKAIWNDGSDTLEFAVLLREEWEALERLDAGLVHAFYRPLSASSEN